VIDFTVSLECVRNSGGTNAWMKAPNDAKANFHDNDMENKKCSQYVMQTLAGCEKII
jgi:hypothetical protein